MKLSESSIFLNDVRLYAYHGVLEQERRVGGEYSVSLRVHYNIYKAMESDDVSDTLNYALLLELVKREMACPSSLLEHVVGRIGKAVFREFPLTLECRVIYRQEQNAASLPEEIRRQFYTIETEDHITYYGEIVDAYIIED